MHILQDFITDLYQICDFLRVRDEEKCFIKMMDVLEKGDALFSCCTVFMDFIHPIFIKIHKSGQLQNENDLSHLKKKVVSKLFVNQDLLLTLFFNQQQNGFAVV